jgi:mannose/cellobiose epimerase-like protein (N-acyl-D-glucosamine 2-epimerase family)
VLQLNEIAAAARSWLFDAAAPLWISADRNPAGLFAERLDLQGQPNPSFRRIFVQARQIWAYCELGRLGWEGNWLCPAIQTMHYLLRNGRRRDGFFIHTFTHEGEPADLRADLYDHCFVLLALAQLGNVTGDSAWFDEAHLTMNLIEARWRHACGGFREGEIFSGPRRQNPHMHLLEAAIALWLQSGHERWRALAMEIADLCSMHFIDPATGALIEFFSDDWSRMEMRAVVEPGHCFEWFWLLQGTGLVLPQWEILASGLIEFARGHGIDHRRGVAINEVALDGQPTDNRARLWPQAERLKAALARYKQTSDMTELREAELAYHGLSRYLQTPFFGVWYDKLDSDASWVPEPAPGSSFYHITGAFSELIRSAEALASKPSAV